MQGKASSSWWEVEVAAAERLPGGDGVERVES